MMKWGRNKKKNVVIKPCSSASSSSNSSSNSHLISHVFPLSWLSKFKLKPEKPEKPVSRIPKTNKQQSQRRVCSPRESNYYKDEDGFWRLSFGDDVGTRFVVPRPYWGNCKTGVQEHIPRKKSGEAKDTAKEEILERTYRRIVEATEELHRGLDEVNGFRKSVEKDLTEDELLRVMQMVGKAEERPPYTNRCAVATRDTGGDQSEAKSEWKQLKDAKIKEVMLKSEKNQRKSYHISREVNNKQAKVRVRSPRTPSKTETCRVRAIEDMKKAKLKKKVLKDVVLKEETAALGGSFAVMKRSCDPQQDFKDSMVEMIREKRITRPDELEELLRCYLTLNADEYHDLIIKVFRQVWSELESS